MIWNVNGNVVSVGDQKFAVNGRWFVEFDARQKLKASALSTYKMLLEDVSCGVVIDLSGMRQIVKLDSSLVGLPALSAYFVGRRSNCCVFAKVGVDRYWAISINSRGFITGSLDNDKIHSLDTLKKFISQEMIMSDEQDSYSIVNIGDDTDLQSVELNSSLNYEPIDLLSIDASTLDDITAERQIGFRRTQIAVAVAGVGAAVLGFGYYFFYVTPPEVNDIANGMYSDSFTQHYNSLKNSEEKLFNINNKPKTKQDIENSALDEFNEYLLMRNDSNRNKAAELIRVHNLLPRRIDGWVLKTIKMDKNSTSVMFKRLSSFPVSLSFKNLDRDLKAKMNVYGLDVEPLRLLSNGNIRVFEVTKAGSAGGLSKEYTAYLARKRENIEGRQNLINKIKAEQSKIDRIKSSIEDSEQSVTLLSAFDAHNSDVVDLIINAIDSEISKSKPLISEIKKDLDKLKSYKRLQPPANTEYMFNQTDDSGFVDILQSIENIAWGQPAKTSQFPSIEVLKKSKARGIGFVGITRYEFKVELDSKSSPLSGIKPLLENKKLFLVGGELTETEKGLPRITLVFEYFVKS
ncbi:hypothetical protein [Photobacterium damselae]|uniref:hypothetical protein n=1 Tax=Photobacterium damselae TaxID=38293 RepID=UPI0040698490